MDDDYDLPPDVDIPDMPAWAGDDAADAVDNTLPTGAAAKAGAPASAAAAAVDLQIKALESKLVEQERLLREWRQRDLAEGGGRPPAELLAEARKRRDLARKAVQTLQARLQAMQAEQREKKKRLDKLVKQSSARAVNPEQALPSVALRGGGDDAAVKEIQALMRETKELEEQLGQHEGTRLHLEKLQNEKRDTARKIKEVRGEEKLVLQQLEMKKAELQELQEQIKPSPVRAKHEADVARLRKEVAAHSASRTHAEREGQAHSKRLLRVRAVLQSFLKAEGFKPQQPLPPADDELAGRLVDYILNLNEKVRNLERSVVSREEKAKDLQASSNQAAEELKRLVARRGKEQRKVSANGLLTDGPAASLAEPAEAPADAGDAPPPPADAATPAKPKAAKKGARTPKAGKAGGKGGKGKATAAAASSETVPESAEAGGEDDGGGAAQAAEV